MDVKKDLHLWVAIKDDDVIVVVKGEATMKISYVLKKFVIDLMNESEGHNRNFKIDLKDCNYMDSTFTGLLVILEKYAKNKLNSRFEILNPSKFCQKILDTMGLIPLFKISENKADYEKQSVALEPFQIEKTEEAILMYLAHKELSGISNENKKEFEDVQKFLTEHIEKETGKDIENISVSDLTFIDMDM